MSLRILIGYSRPGQRGDTAALYVGTSSAELAAVQTADTAHASYGIINNPLMIRKSNPAYDPDASAKPDAKKGKRQTKAEKEAEAKRLADEAEAQRQADEAEAAAEAQRLADETAGTASQDATSPSPNSDLPSSEPTS